MSFLCAYLSTVSTDNSNLLFNKNILNEFIFDSFKQKMFYTATDLLAD